MENENNSADTPQPATPVQKDASLTNKDRLAFIIAALFVVGLSVGAYKYFNFKGNTAVGTETKGEITAAKTEREAPEEPAQPNEAEKLSEQPVTDTKAQAPKNADWSATDYKYGDVKKGDYTVQSGDTLWEIAEAAYGNGAEWPQLLAANGTDIGFLSNGQQALIVPGQVLVIS